jgi:Icc-related predicted phosphoesterase
MTAQKLRYNGLFTTSDLTAKEIVGSAGDEKLKLNFD